MKKQQDLENVLVGYGSICLGYSGGVDSVFLAVTALDVLGADNMLAVTGRSASYPDVQWETARSVAAQFGLPHLEIETDELQDDNYRANPVNRCYYCKSELWSKLHDVAQQRGISVLVDGSNADDAHDHRPGARAGQEHSVRSPLMEVGLTKEEIRTLSRARGLPTWDQPSAPCLSSRLPYGLSVTAERLQQVEAAEQIVRELGVREFRVRHHGDIARLEIAPAEMQLAVAAAAELHARLSALGFGRVVLDVDGYRRGALNETPALVQLKETRPVAQVTLAGHASDIAVVDAPLDALAEVRALAQIVRQGGVRYVTLDLNAQRNPA